MKIKVETEKKYYCEEPEKLSRYAENLNFKLINNETEVDEYFTDIDSDFIKNRTCLRIRKCNDKMEITFKGKSNSLMGLYSKMENNISCDSHEYNNIVSLFSSLGYYSYVEVKKNRMVYQLKNKDYVYNIMIDNLDKIGGFVEFEIISEREKSTKKELEKELNDFVSKFDILNLKEATKPYRDIVAEYVYSKYDVKDNLFLNLDSELLKYEKDFHKKYKDIISKILKVNYNWTNYKKSRELEPEVISLIDEYFNNLIFDSNELLVTFELLKKVTCDVSIITKLHKDFLKCLLNKFNIVLENIIYLNNSFEKENAISKYNIVNDKDIKEVNSLLLILINNS